MKADECRYHEVHPEHPPAPRTYEHRGVSEDALDDDRADEENERKGEQPPHVDSARRTSGRASSHLMWIGAGSTSHGR